MDKLHIIGDVAWRVCAKDQRPAHIHVVAPDNQARLARRTPTVVRGTVPTHDRYAVMGRAKGKRDAIRAAWNDLNPGPVI